LEAIKNGREFSDYIRLLAYTGARNEGLRLRWSDVDWHNQQLLIGADGTAKNREPRRVDFNPKLEAHLKGMFSRRPGAPHRAGLFSPSDRTDRR
jgi:integrase